MGRVSTADALEPAFHAQALKAWRSNQLRSEELTRLTVEWRKTGVCTAEQCARGRALAHSLRGSAGTFGHPEVSIAAERLEETLASVKDLQVPENVDALVDRIRVALTHEPRRDY